MVSIFRKLFPFCLAALLLGIFSLAFLLESGEAVSQNPAQARKDLLSVTQAEQKHYKRHGVYTNRFSDLLKAAPLKISKIDKKIKSIEDGLFLSQDGQELKILIYPLKKGQLSTRLISGTVVERTCSMDIPFCKDYYWQ